MTQQLHVRILITNGCSLLLGPTPNYWGQIVRGVPPTEHINPQARANPMRFWVHTAEKCALPPGPLVLELAYLAAD